MKMDIVFTEDVTKWKNVYYSKLQNHMPIQPHSWLDEQGIIVIGDGWMKYIFALPYCTVL